MKEGISAFSFALRSILVVALCLPWNGSVFSLVCRVLVFSRSVRMLDVIERCMDADESEGGAGFGRVCRIDGSCSDRERQQTIKTFNGSSDIPVCLIR